MIHSIIDKDIAILMIETRKGNTFTLEDIQELSNHFAQLAHQVIVQGIIITGSNRVFSVGGDIEAIIKLERDEDRLHFFTEMDQLLIQLFSLPKPLVVALNGHAIGLGFLIMLCADKVVSVKSERIKLGLPEIKIGMAINAVMGELLHFNNINGKRLANMLYSGELISVSESFDLKLIDEIVDESELIEASKREIEKLLLSHPFAFQKNKELVKEESLVKMENHLTKKCSTIFVELLNTQKTQSLLKGEQ